MSSCNPVSLSFAFPAPPVSVPIPVPVYSIYKAPPQRPQCSPRLFLFPRSRHPHSPSRHTLRVSSTPSETTAPRTSPTSSVLSTTPLSLHLSLPSAKETIPFSCRTMTPYPICPPRIPRKCSRFYPTTSSVALLIRPIPPLTNLRSPGRLLLGPQPLTSVCFFHYILQS